MLLFPVVMTTVTKKRKSSVLDRLRKKLCIPLPANDGGCRDIKADTRQPPNRNACKPTRVVELCWINVTKGVGKKVKPADGGGVRKVSIAKHCKGDELLSVATNLFFPNGLSKFGRLCEFNCRMLDFCEQPVKALQTIAEMYNETKLGVLRFYLHTTDVTYVSDDESLPDLLNMVCESESGTTSVKSDRSDTSECHVTEESIAAENDASVDISEQHVDDDCDKDKHDDVNRHCVPEQLVDVLRHLESNIDVDGDKNIVNVMREDVLDGGFRGFMRKTFHPCRKLSVRFSGEVAIDDGGPTREFLRLALSQIESKLFYGESNRKFLTLDANGMNSCCHCLFTFVYHN